METLNCRKSSLVSYGLRTLMCELWVLKSLVVAAFPSSACFSCFVYYPGPMRAVADLTPQGHGQVQRFLKSCHSSTHMPGSARAAWWHRALSQLWISQNTDGGSTTKRWLALSMDSKEEKHIYSYWKNLFLEQSVSRIQICSDSGLLPAMYRKLLKINKKKDQKSNGKVSNG